MNINVNFKNKIQYEEICKDKYLEKNDTLLFESVIITHDGFDYHGPESNIYDYLIIIERDSKRLYELFHREDWFCNTKEHYYPYFIVCSKKKSKDEQKISFKNELPLKAYDYMYYDIHKKQLFPKKGSNIPNENWLNIF